MTDKLGTERNTKTFSRATCVACEQEAVTMGYNIEDIDRTPVPICLMVDAAHDPYREETTGN